MSTHDLVRVWKDPETADRDGLAEHPLGPLQMDRLCGGMAPLTEKLLSLGCCNGLTTDCW